MAIKQLTLRGFDRELERRLRVEARAGDLSFNKAALRLMRRGAGLDAQAGVGRVGKALDRFVGTWTEAEARALSKATAVFERVDEELWK